VTSIRNSHGNVKVNQIRSTPKHYIILGTVTGQLSLYSHDIDLSHEGLRTEDLALEWSIIAHEPTTGPFDINFGSLCKFINN
jgi:hypothetical protein